MAHEGPADGLPDLLNYDSEEDEDYEVEDYEDLAAMLGVDELHSDGDLSFLSDEELVTDSEDDSVVFLGSFESDSETAQAAGGVNLVLTEGGDVARHGVHTSVPHHQCCDALSLADADGDSLLFTEGKFAVLYDLAERVLVTAVDLGFKPYSIARHEDLFAAVGTRELRIFRLGPDAKKGTGVTFQQVAEFRVGSCQMNNGVRFGRLGNEMKLLVASQDCFVYVFNVPGTGSARGNRPGKQIPGGAGPSSSGAAGSGQTDAKAFLSSSLKKHYHPANDQQPGIYRREPPCLRGPDGAELSTDVIGRFKVALNCVAASPDGKLLAVVGDSTGVWVLDHANNYSVTNMASLSLHGRPHRASSRGYKGCQYVAWNSRSDLLAASSDTDHVVRVWRIRAPTGRKRAATRNSPCDVAAADVVGTYSHDHPCLALQFSPADPDLLFYTESPSSVAYPPRLHAVDVRKPAGATQAVRITDYEPTCAAAQFRAGGCSEGHTSVLQCVKADCPGYRKWQKPGAGSPANVTPPQMYGLYPGRWQMFGAARHLQVTGLAVSRRHGVLLGVAGGGEHGTRNQVLQLRPLEWSYERHRLFPPGFKDATRFLLLAANAASELGAGSPLGSSFRSLPKDVVYSIIEKAAMPQSAWVGRSPPEEPVTAD